MSVIDMESETDKESGTPANSDGSGCGCVTAILFIFAVWALCFGVTVGGKHYGIAGCDTDRGVIFDR